MRFVVRAEDLVKGLKKIKRWLPRENSPNYMPITKCFALRAENGFLRVSCCNLEETAEVVMLADVVEAGSCVTAARRFMELISWMEGEVEIADRPIRPPDESRLEIRCGEFRYEFATRFSVEEFPTCPPMIEEPELLVPAKDLVRLIERTSFAAARSSERAMIESILLEASDGVLRAVASDGHQLSMASAEIEDKAATLRMVVPISVMTAVAQLSKALDRTYRTDKTDGLQRGGTQGTDAGARVGISVNDSGSVGRFRLGDTSISTNLRETNDRKFPSYERVIPKGWDRAWVLPAWSTFLALERLRVVTGDGSSRIVIEDHADGWLRLSADDHEGGAASEQIEVVREIGPEREKPKIEDLARDAQPDRPEYEGYDEPGRPVRIAFEGHYLTRFIARCGSEGIRIETEGPMNAASITAIGHDSWRYIVMPKQIM